MTAVERGGLFASKCQKRAQLNANDLIKRKRCGGFSVFSKAGMVGQVAYLSGREMQSEAQKSVLRGAKISPHNLFSAGFAPSLFSAPAFRLESFFPWVGDGKNHLGHKRRLIHVPYKTSIPKCS